MAEVESGVVAVNIKPLPETTEVAPAEEKKVEINGDHKHEEVSTEVKEVTTSSEKKEKENGETAKEEAPEENEMKEAASAEADVEPEKEVVPPKVILHQFPPGKSIPSFSLYCLKLETFLRLNQIPYENQFGYKAGKKGKLPWIEYKGERKCDSNFIIEFLNEKFEIKMDEEFSDEQRALGRSIQVMLEENTFWALSYNRFIDNYNEYKKLIAPPSGGIGFSVSVKMVQRKVRANLDSQGLGRHTKEEIYQIAAKDIKAVSDILGEKDFLLGEHVSSYDCAVFGAFANILWCGLESPLSTYVKENATNLVNYCERMKALCWIDWADMVLGDKPEPIKKGFSFRKKKAKVQKPKEEEAPAAEADAAAEAAPETTDEAAKDEAPKDEAPKEETPKEEEKPEEPAENKETTEEKVEDTPVTVEE